MKAKKSKTFLSAIALLLVLAIAPISSGAFAQTADDTIDDSIDQVSVGDDGTVTDVETDEVETDEVETDEVETDEVETDEVETDEVETDEVETDEVETDASGEGRISDEERKEQREEMKDRMKELRKEHRDIQRENRQDYRDQRAADVQAFRERIANEFGDKVRQFDSDLRHQPVDPNRAPGLTFEGSTSGYMILGGQAWTSDIFLDGSAYHVTGQMWKVQSTGEIEVADRHAKLDLKGFARGNHLVLNGSGELDNGEKIRLFLRGHFAPTPESGIFAIAFTQAGVHNINTGERIPLMHVGSVEVFPTVDIEPVPLPEPVPFDTLG